jgi:DNA repair protein RadD
MTLTARPYQQEAVDSAWRYLSEHNAGNPCVVLPTGAGKSLVMAMLATHAAKQWGGRVGVVAHVKELVEQNAAEIERMASGVDVGIYSAGLKRRDRESQILVAGIQSVYSRAFDLGAFDLLLVDECHLIPPSGDGMYRRFLADCRSMRPHVRLIGLTATPYRTSSGLLVGPDELLTDICYEAPVLDMIKDGYLSPLISREGEACDTSGLHIRGGEFVEQEAESLMLDAAEQACETLARKSDGRNSVLVFCQSVAHCEKVVELLRGKQIGRVEHITGETPSAERNQYVADFRAGAIRYLCNVNVLTTGFNAPNVDCVALLRPTVSPGLYYQMVGRGFRLSPGKPNCLVLDFGGNIRRHGCVDQVKPAKRAPQAGGKSVGEAPVKCCPQCEAYLPIAATICEVCGYLFPEKLHDVENDERPITSDKITRTDYRVLDTVYSVHVKRNQPDAPRTMRVEHKVSLYEYVSEWVCIEHDGYARRKAEAWWRARSNDPFPRDAEHAVDIANAGGLAPTLRITVTKKADDKYPQIVKSEIGDKPEGVPVGDGEDFEFPTDEPQQQQSDIDYGSLFASAPF